jgi:hypothetical protein
VENNISTRKNEREIASDSVNVFHKKGLFQQSQWLWKTDNASLQRMIMKSKSDNSFKGKHR